MIYVNNAGTSWPKPDAVREAMAAAVTAAPEESARLLASAHAGICRFLGVTDPERLLLTPGCTSALAVTLDDLPWETGDVIVTSSLEHHALVRPVQKLVRMHGVVHRAAPYAPGAPVDLEFVRDVLRRGRVRLVAATAASNVTGELLPVADLVALTREHGALCLVDAAQTVGVIPVDVERLGADIVVFAGHKGPLGPQGIGGLWAASGVVFESPSAACEISSPGPGKGECSPFPGYCDVGSVNLAGAAGLAAGMRWLGEQGVREMGRSARDLARRLTAALVDRPGVTVHGAGEGEKTATVSLTFENLPPDQAEPFFREHRIIVRAGQHCAPMALQAIGAPAGTVRISFGPFNTEEDLERVLAAIEVASPGV